MDKRDKYLYLSYFMDENTPLYGGDKGVSVLPDRSLINGDTANTKKISLHNHSGTHIDYPNHFFIDGLTSEHYGPDFWVFQHPFLINLPADEGKILLFSSDELRKIPTNIDFLIIKTGFGKYRDEEKYWKTNPGLSPQMADQLKSNFPNLKVLGMDFISITSYVHRELGREAHRKFLGGASPILLVEDMDLSMLEEKSPSKIMCFPIMIKGLDGSPVTVIAVT